MSEVDEKMIEELSHENQEKAMLEFPRYMAACRLEAVLRKEVKNQTDYSYYSGLFHGWAKKYKLKTKAIRELCDLLESKNTSK